MDLTWQLKAIPDPLIIQELQEQLQIDPSLATLLVQRGISTYEQAEHYFRPKLEDLHDPFLLKNMGKAVKRFNLAMEKNEKVLIYGDYDVDGTTAVSLFLNAIRKYYSNVDFYIPDRFLEGYGVNKKAIETFHEQGFTLMFTLDCGIKSVDEIGFAKENGMDVIVCDHHEPGEIVPDAWVLNPKQIDCLYPYKELSGCGVTFKFLQALFHENKWSKEELLNNLDLVALSIAADIVPITDENRALCFYGIEQINRKESTVIDLLFQHAKRSYPIQLSDIVFTIAPRINAAGRMKHAKHIVELFTETDVYAIEQQIHQINEMNTERRTLDQQIAIEAIDAVLNDGTQRFSNVVYDENWSKGVIGIVASRLVEKNYRPSIVLTKSNGKLTGSGRSIPEVNLYEALVKCSHHLEQFGGHAFACGLTLKEESLAVFKETFDKEIAAQMDHQLCVPTLAIDLEIDFSNVYSPTDVSPTKLPKFVRVLQQMEPHGPGNMRPVFITKNVYISDFRFLKEVHLKMEFQQKGFPVRLDGIAFNFLEQFQKIEEAKPVDIVYSISVNRWNGKESVQLEIRDVRNSV